MPRKTYKIVEPNDDIFSVGIDFPEEFVKEMQEDAKMSDEEKAEKMKEALKKKSKKSEEAPDELVLEEDSEFQEGLLENDPERDLEKGEDFSDIKLVYTEEELLIDEDEKANTTRMETRARRAVYNEVKDKVRVMERRNTSKMYVFRDYRRPWFKAGGNSAYFYAYDIAGKMGKKRVNINIDRDHRSVFEDGVVSFHGVGNLIANMEKLGYAKPKILYNGWLIVFELDKSYDKSEIRAFRRLKAAREHQVNGLILIARNYPEVHSDIVTLIKRIPPNIFKLNPNQRDAFAGPVMDKLTMLHKTFTQIENGKIKVLDGADQLLDIADWLKSTLKILFENQFWDMSVASPVGQAIAEFTDHVDKCMIQTERNRIRDAQRRKQAKLEARRRGEGAAGETQTEDVDDAEVDADADANVDVDGGVEEG